MHTEIIQSLGLLRQIGSAIIEGMHRFLKMILILSFPLFLSACLKPEDRQNKAQIVHAMATTLAKQYSGVPSVTSEQIGTATLVDVRSAPERLVSTLPNAIASENFDFQQMQGKRVVAFDTLGQRSIEWVSDQRAKGVDAYYLHGGILAHAHTGGKFVDPNGEETKRVHVYSDAWNMLPNGYEAVLP